MLISKQNEELANFIGRLTYFVYNDAKKLTLSAFNFPSRVVCAELGLCFDFNKPQKRDEHMKKFNLQYVNPKSHAEILECIFDADLGNIKAKVENCLALSLRADGSTDRTNTEKVFVLAKIVNEKGIMETLFFGAVRHDDCAKGLLNGMEKAIDSHGDKLFQTVLKIMSSFATDGASVNVGNQNGLWRLTDEAAINAGSDIKILNIWCAAHKSELAWKDMCSADRDLESMFTSLNSLASYFHKSGRRTAKLEKIAEKKKLKLLHLPTNFEVRWTQFSYQMVHSVLMSWNCLALCLKSINENMRLNKAKRHAAFVHLKFLTDLKQLKLIAFIADILFTFSRFQKKLQSDDLNIVELVEHVNQAMDELSEIKSGAQPGS